MLCAFAPRKVARLGMKVGSLEIHTASNQKRVPVQIAAPLFCTVQCTVVFSPEKLGASDWTELTLRSLGARVTSAASVRWLLVSSLSTMLPDPVVAPLLSVRTITNAPCTEGARSNVCSAL